MGRELTLHSRYAKCQLSGPSSEGYQKLMMGEMLELFEEEESFPTTGGMPLTLKFRKNLNKSRLD